MFQSELALGVNNPLDSLHMTHTELAILELGAESSMVLGNTLYKIHRDEETSEIYK